MYFLRTIAFSYITTVELSNSETNIDKILSPQTPKSPLNFKEIKPVNSKVNQPRIFIGRIDAEAETAIVWTPDVKSRLLGKASDAKIEGKRRRGWQRVRWLYSIINSLDMNLSKLQEVVEDRGAWHAAVHGLQRVGHNLVTEQQQEQVYRPCSSLPLVPLMALMAKEKRNYGSKSNSE